MGKVGDSFIDLVQTLRSNKEKGMTLEEANIIKECKGQAMRDLTTGAATSTIVTWLATWKLNRVTRICLTTGACGVLSLWWFERSLDSCVDHILSMDGKRIKDEMAKIVLMKYRDNPSVMQRVSKHFYSENVYDDSSSDWPKLRWRVRTVSSDAVAFERMRTHVYDPDNETTSQEKTTAGEKTKMLQKQAYMRTSIDSIVDPFDYVFGLPQPMTENHQPSASIMPPAQRAQSQRKSRRKHRKQQHESSGD